MKGKISKIKNTKGELALPVTTVEAVYLEDGKTKLSDEIKDVLKYEILDDEGITAEIPSVIEEIDGIKKNISEINSSLDTIKIKKLDKNGILSMANMGQDIKEAMTGGSVAVVGVNSINSINLLKNSVTKSKTDFINTNVVNLINIAKSEVTNINYSTGVKPDYICDDTSIISNVGSENDWLFFFIPLDLEIGKIYTCKARQNNLDKEMSIGLSYTTNPNDGRVHSCILDGDIFAMTFTCNSVTNYLRIHGVNGCVDLKDIIVYEGTDNVIWSLDKEVHITDVDDGIITYDKLSSDIKDLFCKFDDILHLNGCEYLEGINAENYSNIGDSFKVSFIEGSSYFVFKGQHFIKDHKYIITYDVVGDTDYSIGLRNSRVGYPSWQEQILTTNNQTAGAYVMGQVYYNCSYDGCLGFNNSSSKSTNYTCTIRIFDVTNYPKKEIIKTDFSSLKTENIIVKNTLSNNNSSSNNLSEKKLVFYGDSISQSGYFQNMVKNYYNCNVVTNAIGGTTIAYQGSSSFSADERISQLPSDADFVLIMGGTNDWNRVNIGTIDFSSSSIDRTTIKGGLLYTIKGIQEQCPKATIIVCTAIGGRGSSGADTHLYPLVDQFGQSTLDIRNATVEVANIANVECCDTWSCGINGFNRTKYISDTVHPNTEGNKLIGDYIINFLKKYN